MQEDNERDRFIHGYDAGIIIDGEVRINEHGNFLIVDDEGIATNVDAVMSSLVGKQVRFTVISLEAMNEMQNLLDSSGTKIVIDGR